jgi:hypothetical protein
MLPGEDGPQLSDQGARRIDLNTDGGTQDKGAPDKGEALDKGTPLDKTPPRD